MSAQRTKFPKNTVPARKVHQGTTIVGKNGLPVDALATLEPGSVLVSDSTTITYSSPIVTINAGVDLSPLLNFSSKVAKHTGTLIFTDDNNNSYFIDPNSINNTTKTFDIYINPDLTTPPTTISLGIGWLASEAELVNRLQTTTTAVVDNVEFRDVEVKVDLDGSTVNIKDDDGNQLEINSDGSVNTNVEVDAADGDNIAINDSITGKSAEVNTNRELQTRDNDTNTTLTSINSKLVSGNDIGDVTVNNPISNPVQTQLGNGASIIASTTIGSDTLLTVKKGEDPTFYLRIDKPNSSTTFIGKTYDLNALTSAPVWQITRTIVSGTETITQFADDVNTYDKIWDNRVSLFGSAPFANSLSVQFDGANDFVDVSHNAAIDFDFRSESASWNFWIKISNTTSSVTYLEKQASNVGWRFYLKAKRLTLELRGTGGTGDRIRVRSFSSGTKFGTRLNDGAWHMVTATYDGSGLASGVNLYLDGVAESTLQIQNDTLSTDTSNTNNMAIASRSGGGNNTGPGNIDEVSIWDVELSAGDITTIYNSGIPIDLQNQGLSPITVSLNYWCRMGDGSNDVFPILEDVESLITGTMTNMTAGDIEGAVPG